jgi:hypothetical protein
VLEQGPQRPPDWVQKGSKGVNLANLGPESGHNYYDSGPQIQGVSEGLRGSKWVILGQNGSFWVNLANLGPESGHNYYDSGPQIQGSQRPKRAILGHFGPF